MFTHRDATPVEGADVTFVQGDVAPVHAAMVEAAGDQDVWVVGGGDLAAQFAEAGLLDEVMLSIAPVTWAPGGRCSRAATTCGSPGWTATARSCARGTTWSAPERRAPTGSVAFVPLFALTLPPGQPPCLASRRSPTQENHPVKTRTASLLCAATVVAAGSGVATALGDDHPSRRTTALVDVLPERLAQHRLGRRPARCDSTSTPITRRPWRSSATGSTCPRSRSSSRR